MTTPDAHPSPEFGPIRQVGDLLAEGVTTAALRRSVRAGRLQRVHRGVYRMGAPDADDRLVALMAAFAHLGAESTAVLGSALDLHGIAGAVGRRVPEFALPPGLEKCQRDAVSLHFWAIPPEHRTVRHGIPVTSVARTVADAARLLPRMQAVACVDSALSLGLLRTHQLEEVAELMRRRPHCVAGRRHLGEARFDAQSPLETRVRLRADDAGLRPDALQVPVLDGHGTLLGYGDMGYRLPDGSWLIVEADGRAVHELPAALLRDRQRQNAFLAERDVRMLRFTWEDTRHGDTVPGMLRPVLLRQGWRPTSRPP